MISSLGVFGRVVAVSVLPLLTYRRRGTEALLIKEREDMPLRL